MKYYCNKCNKQNSPFSKACISCGDNLWVSNCKTCNSEIIFSKFYAMQTSKNNCKKCRISSTNKKHLEKRISGEIPWPMSGKKLTAEHKQKLSSRFKGESNPMHNKSFYEIWIKKYGKEIAEQKLLEFKNKLSKATSGSNNQMFGKPSPAGSGNGWQGWYKGWRFRSLLELSFIIKIAERFNFKWKSAECHDLKIKYIYNNINRNYYADIILNDKWLVEVKPKNLMNTKLCVLKRDAAIIFCKNRNMKYKIIEPPRLTTDEIRKLVETGEVQFDRRYNKKYNNE